MNIPGHPRKVRHYPVWLRQYTITGTPSAQPVPTRIHPAHALRTLPVTRAQCRRPAQRLSTLSLCHQLVALSRKKTDKA
ncbi:hypothetical protein NAI64_01740 [Oxalobacter sp. OxGP1]|uniref:hypothetical protein n=1 Tax=Oxalobacter paeniformigenes TaxID=2946594 RepID=UPI0022AED5F7|nr:hypothetical protein [Oxalobacter paeniformigenes]MCZ4052443.1 hypothetical protein [Oxalobacter paeniformigenes]